MRRRRCAALLAAWVLLSGLGSEAAAQAAPASPSAPARPAAEPLAEMRAALMKRAEFDFALGSLPQIDAPLLDAARTLAAEHLVRLEGLFTRWLAEEAARGPEADAEVRVDHRVFARYANELVLWRLESAGVGHDAATLAAIESDPQLCHAVERASVFGGVVRRWQGVPAAQRAAFLDAERELLRRWGQAERTLPPRPALDEARALEQAIDELRSGRTPQRWPAMAPVLAHALFADAAPPLSHPIQRCLLQQWWLRARLQAAQAPGAASDERATALAAFRWGQAWRIDDLTSLSATETAAADSDGYPRLGRRFVVTGITSVRVWIGADGRATRAVVRERRLRAPGIPGAPLVFEPLFDAASIERAMAHDWGKPPAAASGASAERVSDVSFVWKLQ